MNILLVLGVLGGLVVGLRPLLSRLGPEGTRKALHTLAGCGLVGLPLLGMSRGMLWGLAVAATAGLVALRCVPALRQRWGRVLHDVQRRSWGELCYPVAVLVAIEAAPSDRVYAAAMLTLALADTAAALAGQRWPERRFRAWGGIKTVAGSVACFAVSAAVCIPLLGAEVGFVVALVATVVEAAVGRGFDNLALPLAVVGGAAAPEVALVGAGVVGGLLALRQRRAATRRQPMRARRGVGTSHGPGRLRRRLASSSPGVRRASYSTPS